MEINRDLIARLSALDRSSLEQLIRTVAQAAGATPGQAERAVRHADTIRARAAAMSEDEIRHLADQLGEEQTQAILRGIKL